MPFLYYILKLNQKVLELFVSVPKIYVKKRLSKVNRFSKNLDSFFYEKELLQWPI